MPDKIKVIDCKQSDNEYLHKDFHGALCYAIKYLDDNFGEKATEEYLIQVGKTYFKPLSEKLKREGLEALRSHWKNIFKKEQGEFNIYCENDKLICEVKQCPAIAHLKKTGSFFTDRYCQTTVIVNKTICNDAGYQFTCEYKSGEGKCVQKVWIENFEQATRCRKV
ncbi:MAG: hypothetical protein A2Y12_00400 [Planctomycetes bacterium GWF2_42_9]|nr:MAG: hypothetical protein A2Y12_00400 [Planctomycetes bacterium GWF2_42_9]